MSSKNNCLLQIGVLIVFCCFLSSCFIQQTYKGQADALPLMQSGLSENNHAQLDTMFQTAYRAFENKEYDRAIELFNQHNELDTALMNYESYAFMAECYHRMNQKDQGERIYKEALQKNSQRSKDMNTIYFSTLRSEELASWKSNYPSFPMVLRKENGFLPYDEWPVAVYKKEPVYPDSALRSGMEGEVFVKALIDEYGTVVSVSFLKSNEKIFEAPALNAVEQWKFSPFKKKGIRTKMEIIVPLKFRISRS
jgi:TonB family protein